MVQPEVTIDQGTLQGTTGTDFQGKPFLKFQGIPYAKPPIGNLRFKAPQPPEKWPGIFDASKEGDFCIHRDPFQDWKLTKGSENCLFLNVYTKRLPKNDNDLRPVLFYIHGGGLVAGSGTEEFYGPDFLIPEDIVLVTINYRLGLLGFINFDDPALEVPGNAGFKDQVMALKWVQKNINMFGGDSNNVTIFGESAGGASVHSLVLSPMTKGLFHKAIAQSGCAINPWASGTNGSKTLAKAMNLEGVEEKKVYDALLKKTSDEIIEIQDKMLDHFGPSPRRDLGLVVEKNSKDPFMAQEPINIMLSGTFNQVPFMIGYTTLEGACFEIFRPPHVSPDLDFEQIIPWNFGYQKGTPESQAVAEKIKKFYFGNEEVCAKNITKKFDVQSDAQFIYGIYVAVMTQFYVSKAPTYLYRVSIDSELNFFKKLTKLKIPGVSHCDDLGYLFKNVYTPEIKPGSIEDISIRRFVKLWTNFAKFGNPTPDVNDPFLKTVWKPVTNANVDCLDIGEDLVPKVNPENHRVQFWKSLFAESPIGKQTQCVYLKPK